MSTEVRKNSQIFQDFNNTYFPEDETQISIVVKELFKKNQPTEVIGLGSKNFIGNKIQSAKKLSLSRLSGIIEYLPEELYIKVKAGTPLKEIKSELD
mgnify:CR=1 FL=1